MELQWGIKQFKAAFFDAESVKKRVKNATRQALSKVGSFVRRRAKSSIRKRKAVSQPGMPPSSHEGSLRRLIFFAYDSARDSVVVGPAVYRKGEAPRLLEHSGEIQRRTRSGQAKRLHYRARPFMKPAGEAEAPKLTGLMRNIA